MTDHLLDVRDLHTVFPTDGGLVRAVDGVTFHLDRGETIGIVGESGCGKSVTALSIMRLVQSPGRISSGQVLFKGRDLTQISEQEMRQVRGREITMIFQDPMTSLNPVFRIGWQVKEPLLAHGHMRRKPALRRAVEMIGKVGIPDASKRAQLFPHEFSGGMRQRAMIAMCLTTTPAVLIADEATTALDVTIQAQILQLLREVKAEFGTAIILISHNLGVVAGMCSRVIVMYAGRVVEEGYVEDVFSNPRHPYTWALLRSIPRLETKGREPMRTIDGSPPDLSDLPSGCAFHPRCPLRQDRCVRQAPALSDFGNMHRGACWVTQQGTDLRNIETE